MLDYLFRWSGAVVDPSLVTPLLDGDGNSSDFSLQIVQIHKLSCLTKYVFKSFISVCIFVWWAFENSTEKLINFERL